MKFIFVPKAIVCTVVPLAGSLTKKKLEEFMKSREVEISCRCD